MKSEMIMNALWIFVIAQVSFLTTNATTPRKCCGDGKNLLVDNKCAPDLNGKSSPMLLKCPDKFVLDPLLFPEEDGFNVTSDGSLSGADFQNLVPPGE